MYIYVKTEKVIELHVLYGNTWMSQKTVKVYDFPQCPNLTCMDDL